MKYPIEAKITMTGVRIKDSVPDPYPEERPTVYADRIGQWYLAQQSLTRRKQLGQYLTPVGIADFMAGLFSVRGKNVRLLDPGAGSGILSCAVCEHLASEQSPPLILVLDVYETDHKFCAVLKKALVYLGNYLAQKHITFKSNIYCEDFVLKHARLLDNCRGLFEIKDVEQGYDLCISNPPYFKITKADPRARASHAVVCGQPNIYSLFMVLSACLLRNDGEMVFITPRSFASGSYFRRFRERFFGLMKPQRIHVFESRRDAFKRDEVLQENIIIKARREIARKEHAVYISCSAGVPEARRNDSRKVSLASILDMTTKEKALKIPCNGRQESVLEKVGNWNGFLNDYGLQISTGPVVPFRAERFLAESADARGDYAPLLWMQNVEAMRLNWPKKNCGKPQYIKIQSRSLRLLVPDATYVLLRRFSAKEEARRLTAVPLLAGSLGAELIGIENHLNYVHKPGGTLTWDEAWGLAVLYNSDFMNEYFRALNGSTQVSATEIRSIPLPPLEVIIEIGKAVRALRKPYEEVEPQVAHLLTNAM